MDELVRRAQRGDRRALEELCRREWRPVYAIAYGWLGNVPDAQDVTQEVFLRALRSLDRYEDSGVPFGAYLATIARNLLRSRWRAKTPTPAPAGLHEELPAVERGPEQLALDADAGRRLDGALARLPDDQRAVIRLRVIEGRPTAEVAEQLGRSPDAVRQLQHRAVVTLRRTLREREEPAR